MIRGHYLPQFYMRFFGLNEKQIPRFDKKTGDKKIVSIESFCCKKGFFALEEADQIPGNHDIEILEKLCASEMEGPVATILEKLINNENLSSLSEEEFSQLLSWMSWIYVMTPSKKNMLDAGYNKFFKNAAHSSNTELSNLIEKSKSKNITTEEARQFFLKNTFQMKNSDKISILFNSLDSIVNLLSQYKWKLCKVKQNEGFLLSGDRPISLAAQNLTDTVGFENAQFLFFPISPSLLLVGLNTKDRQGGICKITEEISEEKTLLPNLLTYTKSERFIIGNHLNCFDHLSKIHKKEHFQLFSTFRTDEKSNKSYFINY